MDSGISDKSAEPKQKYTWTDDNFDDLKKPEKKPGHSIFKVMQPLKNIMKASSEDIRCLRQISKRVHVKSVTVSPRLPIDMPVCFLLRAGNMKGNYTSLLPELLLLGNHTSHSNILYYARQQN